MPVMVEMVWRGVTPEQYEAARAEVNWDVEVAPGAIYHVACFTPEGIRVMDIWESGAQFQTFVEERLMPGVAKVGIYGEPQVEIRPVHAISAPAYTVTLPTQRATRT